MMPPHTDERDLDRLARTGAVPDDHTRACRACSERFTFLSDFYRGVREELRTQNEERISILSSRFVAERVLLLRPFVAGTGPAGTVKGTGVLLLAAQSAAAEAGRFTTVATFAIESTHLLARIVKDRAERHHRVYLLAEDPELKRHVLIGVGGPGVRSPLVPTDAEGVATLALDDGGDWTSSYVVVVAPRATFPLAPPLHDGMHATSTDLQLAIAVEGDGFCFTVTPPPGERVGHGLAVRDDGTLVLREIRDNRLSLSHHEVERITELRLFA